MNCILSKKDINSHVTNAINIELAEDVTVKDLHGVVNIIKLNFKTLHEITIKDYQLRVSVGDWFQKSKIHFNNPMYSKSIVTTRYRLSHKPGYPDKDWKFLNQSF